MKATQLPGTTWARASGSTTYSLIRRYRTVKEAL